MRLVLIGLSLLVSMTSFADVVVMNQADIDSAVLEKKIEMEKQGIEDQYSLKIYREDLQMVARVNSRIALSRKHEASDCLQSELSKIDSEVEKAKMKYGESFDSYDEKIYREDLQIVARVKVRACLMNR